LHSGGTFPVLSTKAYVVHDPSGRIYHVHQVVTFEGGREPTSEEITEDALAQVRKRMPSAGEMTVLAVEPDAMKLGTRYRVDAASRSLTAVVET
jgi:hypothetical protein